MKRSLFSGIWTAQEGHCLVPNMCSVHVENSNFVAFRKPKLASLFVLSSYFIIRRLGLCANMSSCKRVAEGIRRRGSI